MVAKHNPAVLPAGSTDIVWWHIGINHPPFKNPGSTPESLLIILVRSRFPYLVDYSYNCTKYLTYSKKKKSQPIAAFLQ